MRRTTIALAALLLVCGNASTLSAQGTATLGTDDPLYTDLRRLIDAGLVDTVIVGQRPWSWAQIARITTQAQNRLARQDSVPAPVRAALERASRRLVAEAPPTLRHAFSAGVLYTDGPARAVPDNGLGTIEADLNTLTNYRQGRRYVTGGNITAEADVSLQVAPMFSVQARGRGWGLAPSGPAGTDATAEILAANARLMLRNVAITVGREYTDWMPAEGGGVFFSANAPALDMVRVASDRPFVLPWLFRYLGPVGATLQAADLGSSVSNSHSRLVSYKVSIAPANGLELGATFENHFGGAGARNPSATDRFIDLVPFLDIFKKHHDSTDFDSDKLLGVDARLQLRRAANVTLFGELAIEDFDIHRPGSVFTEDAAWAVGMLVPELGTPALSARVRFHTVGIRFYEHHLVRNGIASRRFTLGDDLGHDATGYSAALRWDGGGAVAITGDVASDERRNDEWEGRYVNPDSTGLEFRRLTTLPRERRVRGLVGVEWRPLSGALSLRVRGGAERTSNFGFVTGSGVTHGVAEFAMGIYR